MGMLRTEEMKIIFVRAKLLIMVIFPHSVKSLGDQTLRHFSRVTNFFQSYSVLKLSNHVRRKRLDKRTLWASLC